RLPVLLLHNLREPEGAQLLARGRIPVHLAAHHTSVGDKEKFSFVPAGHDQSPPLLNAVPLTRPRSCECHYCHNRGFIEAFGAISRAGLILKTRDLVRQAKRSNSFVYLTVRISGGV